MCIFKYCNSRILRKPFFYHEDILCIFSISAHLNKAKAIDFWIRNIKFEWIIAFIYCNVSNKLIVWKTKYFKNLFLFNRPILTGS